MSNRYPMDDGHSDEECVGVTEPPPDPEMADLFLEYPWLATLQPFYVEWELIWLM